MPTAPVISSLTITPTLWLVASFSTPTGATSYTVTATSAGHTLTSTGHTASPARCGALALAAYSVTVTANYAGPTSATSAPVSVTASLTHSRAAIVRQAVWDILKAAALALDSRTLSLVSDSLFRPALLIRGEAAGLTFPAVEVGLCMRTAEQRLSTTRRREVYSVPIRIFQPSERSDGRTAERLEYALDAARVAIDATPNIGLADLSVLQGSWTWQTPQRGEIRRDRLETLSAALDVPVLSTIGEAMP